VEPDGTPRGNTDERRLTDRRKGGEKVRDEKNSGSWAYLGTVCGEDLERISVERKEELS
jgi:hypothetical protein